MWWRGGGSKGEVPEDTEVESRREKQRNMGNVVTACD